MQKFLLGIAALLAIAVILVGVPIALIIVAGNPIPSGDQLHRIVTLVPDYGNVILLSKVLPCLGWIAWILFAAPLLVEIGAGIAGQRTAKRFLLLKGQQQAAAVLVAAVLVMFAGLGSIHGSAPSAASTHQAPTTTIQFAVPPPTVPPHAPAVEPADITVASVPEPSTETVIHTVVRGDNLWDISERYYGVGTRDMDIFRASTGTVQAGGERLTNPNLILPGWRLTVPDAPAPPTVAAPAPASVPHNIPDSGDAAHDRGTPTGSAPSSLGNATAAPQNSSEATPSRTPKPSQISKPSPVADKAAASPTALAVPLTTAGGLVGLLAAALLVVLGRRRLGQRRRRRPGERIAMPEAATAELEQELRLVANPLGLTDIDNSLRLLQLHAREMGSALPELLAVRLVEEEISLYFMQPADLPAPFEPVTPERTVWTLRPGAIIPPSSATVSPYPALVIIGVDDNDGVLLLDLEQVGVLNILGEESLVLGVLNAVAGELAGNPWGEQIQVTLVGMRSALPQSMDRFRIRHVEHIEDVLAELDGDLQRRGAALRSFGVDNVRAARTLVAETESWAPHIVVLAHSPDETLRRQLADLVASRGRLGVAIVANGSVNNSRATVRVDSSGHAELLLPGNSMPPLPFTPQFLRERELELLQDLIDTTEKDAADPVASEREPVPTPTLDTATTILPASDIPVERRLVDQPDAHDQPRPDGEEDGVPPEILEGMRETAQIAPYLRFLGPVEAEGLGLDEPMPGRGIELMVYLLLRDGPVDGLQLQRAFWPDTPDAANNQRGLAKKVRVALGHNRAGELWLPENINHHGYLLHPDIGSDWDDFRALTGDDPTLASTDNLITALHLVRGTPFAGCNTRRWWQWIAIPQEEMIAAVMDAADELGNRALQTRNAPLARYAARIEQAVDPLNEAGWRIELRAALQDGDIAGFHAVLHDLYARVGGKDPDYDVDEDTQILIDQASQRIRA